MATCDPQALLNSANCFDCLTNQQLEQVQVQLLCNLVNGGLAGGPFVRISGDTMTGPLGINTLLDALTVNLDDFVIKASGRIGVGLIDPTSSIELYDNTSSGTISLSRDAGSTKGTIRFGRHNGGTFQETGKIVGNASSGLNINGQLLIYASDSVGGIGNPQLIIQGATNTVCATTKFGVDTLSPASKADIVGNLTVGATYGGVNAAPTSGAIIEGRVGIGTNAPNANAILDLTSTVYPFLPPRMTTAQRNAVAGLTAGMTIYNTDTDQREHVNNALNWVAG